MIPLALSSLAALATDPVDLVDDGTSVRGLVWARAVQLDTPQILRSGADPVSRGVLVELRVDPGLLEPSQGLEPVLYAGSQPAMRFNWDWRGGCLVAFLPITEDLANTELFFGSLELPERIDAARGARERDAARRLGITPRPGPEVYAALSAGGGPLIAADLRRVHEVAMERVSACSTTEADHQRAGANAAP
ncbi:MAG TPA: hypothetical protein ENK18_05865 [Deltaproteobacteria bacterium]|nr:hypothetical protein [Deltaproteobacteria bacterium]